MVNTVAVGRWRRRCRSRGKVYVNELLANGGDGDVRETLFSGSQLCCQSCKRAVISHFAQWLNTQQIAYNIDGINLNDPLTFFIYAHENRLLCAVWIDLSVKNVNELSHWQLCKHINTHISSSTQALQCGQCEEMVACNWNATFEQKSFMKNQLSSKVCQPVPSRYIALLCAASERDKPQTVYTAVRSVIWLNESVGKAIENLQFGRNINESWKKLNTIALLVCGCRQSRQ